MVKGYIEEPELIRLYQEAAVDAILRTTRDPPRRAAMKRAARDQAMEFSWPRIAAQFAALYARIG